MPSEYVLQQLERLKRWMATGEPPAINEGPWGAKLPEIGHVRGDRSAHIEFVADNIIAEITKRDSELAAVFRAHARLSAELFNAEQSLRDSIALTFMGSTGDIPYAVSTEKQRATGEEYGADAYAFAAGVLEAREADRARRKQLAKEAVKDIQRTSAENGNDKMTETEIDAEIKASRKERP